MLKNIVAAEIKPFFTKTNLKRSSEKSKEGCFREKELPNCQEMEHLMSAINVSLAWLWDKNIIHGSIIYMP